MAKRQETIGAGLQRKAPTIRRWSRNRRRWTGTRLLLLDFLLAWALGIVFQYFTIAPMRGLSFGKGVLQAMRADTLSIVGFQIGMSAWAALVHFVLFTNPHLQVNEAVFWFMMQIGMMIGFISSYPVNLLLIKAGWKERMPQYRDDAQRAKTAVASCVSAGRALLVEVKFVLHCFLHTS